MSDYEHIQEFTVKYCEADFKDELKVSALFSYFEEVACSSADELGFGYEYVKPRGYAFMVTGLSCVFYQPITLGERIRVKTWPTPPTHAIFGREYLAVAKNNEIKVKASSRWCLIDMKENKLLPAKAIDNQDYSTYNTTELFDNVRWKMPAFKPQEGELRFVITIANSEYDHNMHVNNTRYTDYCFNCFSVAELSKRKLQAFTIAYVKQCKEGERLRFYRQHIAGGNYLIQGFNDMDRVVAQAQIEFDEMVSE